MAISQLDDRSKAAGPNINPARVLERILRFWYVILFTLSFSMAVAYLVNRYTTRIYPVSASIIIRESDENIGAKFLYNNSLINPYRNYFNEFFIMRSYPLLQQVVEDLNLDVSYLVKGDIKSTEWYMPHFPVRIRPAKGHTLPYGKSFNYKLISENEFTLQTAGSNEEDAAGRAVRYRYNDTIMVGESRLVFQKTKSFQGKWIGMEFTVTFNDPYALARHYSGALQLNWAESGSAVVNLYLQGPVPQKEKDFLSKFIEYYQQYDVSKKVTIATKSIEFLDRQVNIISDSLRFYEDKIARLTLNSQNGVERGLERMTSLGETLDGQELQTRLQERYYNYLEEYMNSGSDFDQVLLPSSLGVSDPVLGGLVSNLVELQFEMRILKEGMAQNSSNPLVQESKDRIEQYKRDISEGVRSAREIMKINRNLLRERMKELESGLTTQPEPDKALSNTQRNYKLNEGLYSFLIQKRAEAAISQASTTSDIIVVNNPSAGGAITPVPIKNYTYALAMGLLFPLALFVLMEFFNDKVQSKEDIEAISTVPVIGTIGHNITGTNLATMEKPKSYLAESFRALRSNLNYFTEGKDKKVILVTSSISGEGKSFTSINLSTVIAFTGKRVILIGGDMRKSEIAKDFDASNRTGLSLYLSGQAGIEEIIHKTKVQHLDFITPGPTPPNPAELYLSPRVTELFSKLLDTYDYVIVDSPPVGLVSDALALIPLVDHVLFVTRQGYTPLTAIAQMQYMVDQGKLNHVSILLNDITRMGMGYGYKYGYGYDYGYGYRYGHNRYYGSSSSKNKDDVYYSEG